MPDSPRVTSLLRAGGLVDTAWFTEDARARGSALHLATQYLDEGVLDWDSVDPLIVRRLAQYSRFLDEVKPTILAIEEEVVNEALNYHGHLDRRLIINGAEGVLDIKGPAVLPWQGVQTALYAACFPRPMKRWGLHLSDERYQLIPHRDPLDWPVAKACITINSWRLRHYGKESGTGDDREAVAALTGQ